MSNSQEPKDGTIIRDENPGSNGGNGRGDTDDDAMYFPSRVDDLAPALCRAHKVQVRADRPCLFFKSLLSRNEALNIQAEKCNPRHDTQPRSLEIGCRSEFSDVDETLSRDVWARMAPFLPLELDGSAQCLGLRSEWHHARYFPGQAVFAHMDQRQTSAETREDAAIGSRMTVTIYLDEGYEGAEFVFTKGIRMDGSYESKHMTLRPQIGDAVLFYQGVPEFSHAVPKLIAGTKTIMRSDVMYQFHTTEEADVGGIHVQGGASIPEQ